jgi:hypothetical protein
VQFATGRKWRLQIAIGFGKENGGPVSISTDAITDFFKADIASRR